MSNPVLLLPNYQIFRLKKFELAVMCKIHFYEILFSYFHVRDYQLKTVCYNTIIN